MVPKGCDIPIKQDLVNVFDNGSWKNLSHAEVSSRPKPTKVCEPKHIPFFAEPRERALCTLHDYVHKEQGVSFHYCTNRIKM